MTASPLVLDLSRARLRELSHWIRDDLDLLVAREGPEHLRADDVLALHDIFQVLQSATHITALDLRATGMHRAVMDIMGVATRWPSRLADDCDQLVSIWTANFGRLTDLHPFLYGRGGRLEGIASVEETSKNALLERWNNTCADKIAPKRSRQRGDLGFSPGAWWINPLFACHAGIIDMDTVDGGICYDKYGAYAVVLVEGCESHTPTDTSLTYRCGKQDPGKFRLTAATRASRQPIRVLRSHSVNSIWGPKAGIRYEGLYRVTGWTIHQPKPTTTFVNSGISVSLADTIYDVHLERCDPVPMEEVAKFPTASELDDYSEYKRLRKIHRTAQKEDASKMTTVPLKTAPIIQPLASAHSAVKSFFEVTPSPPHTTIVNIDVGESQAGLRKSRSSSVLPTVPLSHPDSPSNGPRSHPLGSIAALSGPSTPQPGSINIRGIAPWIDYEISPLSIETSFELASRRRSTKPNKSEGQRTTFDLDQRPTLSKKKSFRKKIDEEETPRPRSSSYAQSVVAHQVLGKNQSRRSIFMRGRSPATDVFEGTDGSGDCHPTISPQSATTLGYSLAMSKHHARASPSVGEQAASIAPRKPSSSIETSQLQVKYQSLDNPFTARPYTSSVLGTPTTDETGSKISRHGSLHDMVARKLQALRRAREATQVLQDLDIRIAFRDPFGTPSAQQERRSESSDVAPDEDARP